MTEEFIAPGHNACQGCGGVLALRYILKGLGKNTVISLPASCWSVINGRFPASSILVPVQNVCFEVGAGEAAGMAAAYEISGKKINVLALAGDGGTYDIGLQALSGAAERNDNIIFVCYNNEAYMNTGIQRSGATPFGAQTTTTPTMKLEKRKDMMAIVAAHRIPYAATASIAFPEDLIAKVKKASEIRGFKYIDVFSSCPTGWRHDPGLSIKVARLAVTSRVWPLYEIEDGEKYTINEMPKQIPVEEYLKLQGRFQNLTPELTAQIQSNTDKELERLKKLENLNQ
jgi:pyruvate/2-oxoacid:ferredoxin oxidoreductase beta subunit